MSSTNISTVKPETKSDIDFDALIPSIYDFPKKGITFRNISPLLRDVAARDVVINALANHYLTTVIDVVVGLDARGFIFGALLADRLRLPFVMARKPSKLPGDTVKVDYKLEYGSASLELEASAIKPNQNVMLVDDILATGGTLLAAAKLIRKLGGNTTAVCCVCEILGLDGAERIEKNISVSPFCLIKCNADNIELDNALASAVPLPMSNPKAPFVLLWHPTMATLAKKLYHLHNNLFNPQQISWKQFPDGFPNVHFPADLAGKRIVFLASLDKATYMDQLSVMAVLPRQLCKSLDIFLPYYAPGTMERVETAGTLATADTYAKITSRAIPLTREGPPVFSVYDLHNSVTRFSFTDDVCFQPLSAINLILDELSNMYNKYAVVFPDEGSFKRFRGIIPANVNMIVCSKIRDGDKRTVRIVDRIPNIDLKTLSHAIIVDDLIQSGGTIHETHMALVAEGIKSVSAYCTHAVFPKKEYFNFFPGGKFGGLENFWISDSVPKNADLLAGKNPFRVISLAGSIADNLIKRYTPSVTNNFTALISSTPVISVLLASRSVEKIAAVKSAFQLVYPYTELEIHTADVDSDVSAQPTSITETIVGAQNRLNRLNHARGPHFEISMENGIDTSDGKVLDIGVVIVENTNNCKKAVSQTEPTPVDKEIWEEYLATHKTDPTLTCGKIYQKNKGYSSSNWHVSVGKSRVWLLRDAVVRCLYEINSL